MLLNMRTSESGESEVIGIRMYTEIVQELDELCKEKKVKRSVMLRHIINEYLDAQGEES